MTAAFLRPAVRLLVIASLVALTAVGCTRRASGRPRSDGCSPPPPGATPSARADVARLAGAWEVTTVTTTPGLPRRVQTVYLELAPTDSAERFYQPRAFPGAPVREQPLSGRLVYEHVGRTMSLALRLRGAFLVPDDAAGPCFDCGPLTYEVQHVGDDAFWGRYRSSNGGHVIRRTPDRQWIDGDDGPMCARRVSRRSAGPP